MSRFPDDHPVEAIRGMLRPNRDTVLRVIADRSAWLHVRIARATATGRPSGLEMRELVAMACAAEVVEAVVGRDEDVGDVLREMLDDSPEAVAR